MKKFAEESDLLGLGLLRPWEGAIIGFLLFTLLTDLSWISNSPLLGLLLLPGILTESLFHVSTPPESLHSLPLVSKILFWGIDFGVSAIPPTILGSLIRLNKKFGIALLFVYTLILLIPLIMLVSFGADH